MSGLLGMMLASSGTKIPVLIGSPEVDTGTTTLTIDKPTGALAGDLLLAIMGSPGSTNFTGDTGWSEIVDVAGTPSRRIAGKTAGGAEGSNYTFTAGTVGVNVGGAIFAYRDAAFDVVGTSGTASAGADIIAPSVSMSSTGILFAWFVTNQPGRTFTTPTGMLPLAAFSGSAPSFALFYQQLGAGATGTRTSTPSGSGDTTGILFAIKGA